jgi:hypothetical protein
MDEEPERADALCKAQDISRIITIGILKKDELKRVLTIALNDNAETVLQTVPARGTAIDLTALTPRAVNEIHAYATGIERQYSIT